MAEFKISRLRFRWKGTWAATRPYIKDDIVQYGGKSYVCIRQHTSSLFLTDQTYTPVGFTEAEPAWEKMTDGYAWTGDWSGRQVVPGTLPEDPPTVIPGRTYAVGDIVAYGGSLYLCIVEHTAAQLFDDIDTIDNWVVFSTQIAWTGDWAIATRYGVNDLVKYNGIVYRCIVEHSSGSVESGLESSFDSWEVYNDGVQYVGEWVSTEAGLGGLQTGVLYSIGDLVKFGGSIWKCKKSHTSGDDSTINFDADENWEVFILGYQSSGIWTTGIVYQLGDLVTHGGNVYYSLTNNYNSSPGASVYQANDRTDPADWQLVSKGFRLVGDWTANTTDAEGVVTPTHYKTGDVVRRGGNVYVALLDTEVTADGSSLDYLDASNWELVIPGTSWKDYWRPEATYSLGDAVIFAGTTYRANIEHVASTQNYPGDNGSGFAYWDIVLLAGPNVAMTARGDLLTYDLSRDMEGDGSSFGTAPLHIGQERKLLSVDNQDSLEYRTWGNTTYLVNVRTDGVDDISDPERGYNYFKPWKTIRFACDQIEKSGLNLTNTFKVRVWPGVYEEVLPIIIPKNVTVQGDETRSVTVKPNAPITALAVDLNFTVAVLQRIQNIIVDLVIGAEIEVTVGNTEPQAIPELGFEGNSITGGALDILIETAMAYMNYKAYNIGENPEVIGTNTAIDAPIYLNSINILEANKEFLAAEAVAYMRSISPNYIFDGELCKRDIRAYIDAWKYDLLYTGNYKTLLASRYYANAVLGSSGEDMFYVRDATGVRNMTLTGLIGEVTAIPEAPNEIFRRPLGGSYVSLDPGWGPDDDRTWITTRSCYIQNCATFGYGVTGQKIDGALHNGGNKSIVSNDFTQIISDGVGAHVLNNGRAELVSVFTYYSHIGYFAEQGGIIRATNGNNSYGTWGAIAFGVDPSETPTYGNVNTRSGQALVSDAFAGESNDEILILEYINAGQAYSSATYSIVGSGTNAEVIQEEFRDKGVFDVRIIDPVDSGRAGGGGYTVAGNQAQAGDAYTITIASNNDNIEAELLGLRIIITSGTGTGQYGYVYAFDDVGKVVTVYKESNGQPGWDHVIPGRPAVVLNTSSVYRFEPRPVFSSPPNEVGQKTMGVTATWNTVAYGETTETYTNVIGTAGTGIVIEDDGLSPFAAKWNISKVGRTYTVTLADPGAGYLDGESVTVVGTLVGGTTPDNDVRIVITETTNDSTNAVKTFTYSGVGASGRYVAMSTDSNAAYTSDGDNWTAITLPVSGDWRSLESGNNRFVAVRYNSAQAISSLDGINWTVRALPASRQWTSVTYGPGLFVAIAENLNSAAISYNGTTWTTTNSLPTFGDSSFNQWVDIAYGRLRFVAIANTTNISAMGRYDPINWTAVAASITAIVGGSTTDPLYVLLTDSVGGRARGDINNDGSITATDATWITNVGSWAVGYQPGDAPYEWAFEKIGVQLLHDPIEYADYINATGRIAWRGYVMDVIADSSQKDWVSIAYGNGKFVAISAQGDVGYTFEGETWYPAVLPTQDGSTAMTWTDVTYGNGVFVAVCNTGSATIGADITTGPTSYAVKSYDGIVWEEITLASELMWKAVCYGNPDISLGDSTVGNNTGLFIAVSDSGTAYANTLRTGAKTLGRCVVEAGLITRIKIWEPGGGYTIPPLLNVVDPNATSPVNVENRVADGVLGQPTWLNRGLGYRTSSTDVTITGNGFADIIPVGKFITINNLTVLPGPGAQFRFGGGTGTYTVVVISDITEQQAGKFQATFRISPVLTIANNMQNDVEVEIRERYSQCRITGHDFLDVGTGNFLETNYPEIYSTGLYTPAPENEIYEDAGGRVFYTSTDQSGNFRAGELFSVEQATGVVTISADYFDLNGLSELKLGGIRVGGSGVVIREFSTDPLFSADSNNVVPTQRAIKRYLNNRLTIGGSELVTASFIAGVTKVGPDLIGTTVAGTPIEILVPVDFSGKARISGSIIAEMYFYKSNDSYS